MPIVVRLDVQLSLKKMKSKDLAARIGITAPQDFGDINKAEYGLKDLPALESIVMLDGEISGAQSWVEFIGSGFDTNEDELQARIEVHYKVVINEAVNLARRFGAEDGHKYINALLDRASEKLRAVEHGKA